MFFFNKDSFINIVENLPFLDEVKVFLSFLLHSGVPLLFLYQTFLILAERRLNIKFD